MWFYAGDEPDVDGRTLRAVAVKARAAIASRAFEQLVAAHARRDDAARHSLVERIDAYAAAWNGSDGHTPLRFDGGTSDRWIGSLLTSADLHNSGSEWAGQASPADGGYTDVQAPAASGPRFSIEVKAQFTKLGLGDITQADYLTGYSDFLAHFIAQHPKAQATIKRLFPQHLAKLRPRTPIAPGWTVWDLMLAELVGLYDAEHLAAADVSSTDDLAAFANDHYLLHAVGTVPPHRKHAGGARLIRFTDFPLVAALIVGETPRVVVKENTAAVALAFSHRDDVEYTIHVGYRIEALSKSKLHIAFFDGAKGLHVE